MGQHFVCTHCLFYVLENVYCYKENQFKTGLTIRRCDTSHVFPKRRWVTPLSYIVITETMRLFFSLVVVSILVANSYSFHLRLGSGKVEFLTNSIFNSKVRQRSRRGWRLCLLLPHAHSSSNLSARWDYCSSLRWPLSPRLLEISPRPWVFIKGETIFWWVRIGNVNYEFVKRLEGKEYSQRSVYRGPTSSVLYFSVQPSYSCWMVRRIL